MQTTINWREYPNERPTKASDYLVRIDKNINTRRYNIISVFGGDEWFTRHRDGELVTHFALPEDITTTDTQKEGEE